ncbi:MAG: tRNA guanosine(34) transglycosylase Tgt [Verrucomicrobiota bacterium]
MVKSGFELLSKDAHSSARRGRVTTQHGVIETPIFMPVGTQATVKAVFPWTLEEIDAQIILGNTYHLNLRPTSELVKQMGGLHKFMQWSRPILTDSGGFQVFSLAKLRTMREDGVEFKSHLDGRKIFLGPKESLDIQANLGSDIHMVLDECPPFPCEKADCAAAVNRTLRWAKTSREYAEEIGVFTKGNQVFGIVQGSTYEDLRRQCAEQLAKLDFPGYAIGGVSVGEPEPEMLAQIAMTTPFMPENKPRYAMGIGTPTQLLKMIAQGVDMFDCVMPSRAARHGTAYTPWGKVNIRNERFKYDEVPLVPGLENAAQRFSKSYLRHLIIAGEPLGGMLLTLHNLHFYLDVMRQARAHLETGTFASWHLDWIARFEEGDGTPH